MAHLDCHAFFNFMVEEELGKLYLNAFGGIPEEEARKIEWLDFGVAVCGCAAKDRTRIVAEDIFHTPDIRTDLVRAYGIQAYACHPLMVGGQVIGTLSFGTRTRPSFSAQDLSVMKTVADQVAVAMERIRLIEGLRKSRDELELRVMERTADLLKTIQRLEILNNELQEFAFVASHDLQEPLRKIQTFCDLASKNCSSGLGGKTEDYLERVANSACLMRQLLHDLLEFSRVASRAQPFSKIDLTETVREAADIFEPTVKETGCRIELHELPSIEADQSQMLRLFQNLIGNSLKYRNDTVPRIEISGKIKNDFCEITVEDNGIGFEQQYSDLIFKPFQRLHKRGEYSGTGMGLSICRKIVERHGGTIRADGVPGKGAVFTIRLPLKQAKLEGFIC